MEWLLGVPDWMNMSIATNVTMAIGMASALNSTGIHTYGFFLLDVILSLLCLIYAFQLRAFVVVEQYVFIVVTHVAHHRRANLAQSDAMSPSRTMEDEPFRYFAVGAIDVFCHECRTEKVGGGQCTSDFQFFADGECQLLAHYLQFDDSARLASFDGTQCDDSAEVHAHFGAYQLRQFSLGVFNFPSVEVGGFLVVVVEYLREDAFVGGVAEGETLTIDH